MLQNYYFSQLLILGLDDRGSILSTEDHPASYAMDTGDSFSGGKAARAWSWPFTSHLEPRLRMHGAIVLLPNMSSWLGA